MIMNLEKNPFTQDTGPDFLQATSLEDLYGRLRVEREILGDDGEQLDAEDVISQIQEGNFDSLPTHNGLRHRARFLYEDRFQRAPDISADLD
jgi:hypothetical protein